MKYYLGLGSNLGDSKSCLRRALELIEQKNVGKVKARSHLYLTEPIGGPEQPWFLNAAAMVESELKPEEMMRELIGIEAALGRERKPEQRNFPRTIDLDILLVDDMIIKGPEIFIPHPRMRERKFVLLPLAEIAGDLMDPEQKKSLRGVLEGLKDNAQARKLEENL